jgi:two-component system, OmpR family, response regulator
MVRSSEWCNAHTSYDKKGLRSTMPDPVHSESTQPQILVVDDDAEIRHLVTGFLCGNGYRAQGARDGREMRQKLGVSSFDLVVLDLMLPGEDGLELCRRLRATSTMPIIMLTAKGDETDRIVGLEVGADDYLAKPFNPRELLARIKAVLRRTSARGHAAPEGKQAYLFDGWRLDTLRRELTNPQGVMIDLSTGEYDLLLALVDAPSRVLTREHLLDAARNRIGGTFDRSIDVQMSRLRRKIEAGDAATDMVKTVRGAGYMFLPKVTRA